MFIRKNIIIRILFIKIFFLSKLFYFIFYTQTYIITDTCI